MMRLARRTIGHRSRLGPAVASLPTAVFDLDFTQAAVDSALTVGTSSGWDRTETWSATATAGSRHTVGASGTLTTIKFETTAAQAGSNVQGFIYSDNAGSPNSLLATTNTQTGVTLGTNTLTINSGGLTVTAGQVLWVGLQESGSSSFSIRALSSTGTNAYWADTPPLDDPATGGGIFYAHAHQWAVWGEGTAATVLGGTDVANSSTTSTANTVFATAWVPAQNLTITHVLFQCSAAHSGATVQVGVYSNSGSLPASRLGMSAQITGVASGVNRLALTASVALTAGTTYWLVMGTDSSWAFARVSPGPGGSGSSANTELATVAFPAGLDATWTSGGASSSRYVIYGEGTGSISPAVAQLAAAGFVFARSGTAWGPDGTAYADGVPRIIPGVGLLIEGSRQNTCLRSQEFDHATWAKTNLAVTANGLAAPDGTATADLLTRTSTAASCYCGQPQSFTAGTAYTASVFAKAGTLGGRLGMRLSTGYPARVDALFDLTTGTVVGSQANTWTGVSATITPLPGGWYRCTLTGTASATANNNFFCGPTDSGTTNAWEATSAVLSDVHVWQAQVEAAAFASSPIVTSGSAVTRNADSVLATGRTGLERGTVAVEAQLAPDLASGEHQYLWELNSSAGGSTNRTFLYRDVTDTRMAAQAVASGVGQGTISSGAVGSAPNGTLVRAAYRWDTDDLALSAGGLFPAKDSSATIPAMTRERLGDSEAANRCSWAYLRRVRRFAVALDDDTLRSLSA